MSVRDARDRGFETIRCGISERSVAVGRSSVHDSGGHCGAAENRHHCADQNKPYQLMFHANSSLECVFIVVLCRFADSD